jgi:hypothetical protein
MCSMVLWDTERTGRFGFNDQAGPISTSQDLAVLPIETGDQLSQHTMAEI